MRLGTWDRSFSGWGTCILVLISIPKCWNATPLKMPRPVPHVLGDPKASTLHHALSIARHHPDPLPLPPLPPLPGIIRNNISHPRRNNHTQPSRDLQIRNRTGLEGPQPRQSGFMPLLPQGIAGPNRTLELPMPRTQQAPELPGPGQGQPALPVLPMVPIEAGNRTGPPINLVFPGQGDSSVVIPLGSSPQNISGIPSSTQETDHSGSTSATPPSPGRLTASGTSNGQASSPTEVQGPGMGTQSPDPQADPIPVQPGQQDSTRQEYPGAAPAGPQPVSEGAARFSPESQGALDRSPSPTLSPLPDWVRSRAVSDYQSSASLGGGVAGSPPSQGPHPPPTAFSPPYSVASPTPAPVALGEGTQTSLEAVSITTTATTANNNEAIKNASTIPELLDAAGMGTLNTTAKSQLVQYENLSSHSDTAPAASEGFASGPSAPLLSANGKNINGPEADTSTIKSLSYPRSGSRTPSPQSLASGEQSQRDLVSPLLAASHSDNGTGSSSMVLESHGGDGLANGSEGGASWAPSLASSQGSAPAEDFVVPPANVSVGTHAAGPHDGKPWELVTAGPVGVPVVSQVSVEAATSLTDQASREPMPAPLPAETPLPQLQEWTGASGPRPLLSSATMPELQITGTGHAPGLLPAEAPTQTLHMATSERLSQAPTGPLLPMQVSQGPIPADAQPLVPRANDGSPLYLGSMLMAPGPGFTFPDLQAPAHGPQPGPAMGMAPTPGPHPVSLGIPAVGPLQGSAFGTGLPTLPQVREVLRGPTQPAGMVQPLLPLYASAPGPAPTNSMGPQTLAKVPIGEAEPPTPLNSTSTTPEAAATSRSAPCHIFRLLDAPNQQSVAECNEPDPAAVPVVDNGIQQDLSSTIAPVPLTTERQFRIASTSSGPGAAEGDAFPVTFVNATEMASEDMPSGVKGGIAGSGVAAAAAVCIGVFLFAAERRKNRELSVARSAGSGVIPLIATPSFSSASDDALDRAETWDVLPSRQQHDIEAPAPPSGFGEIRPAGSPPRRFTPEVPSTVEHGLLSYQSPIRDCDSIAGSFYTAEGSPSPLPLPLIDEEAMCTPSQMALPEGPTSAPAPAQDVAAASSNAWETPAERREQSVWQDCTSLTDVPSPGHDRGTGPLRTTMDTLEGPQESNDDYRDQNEEGPSGGAELDEANAVTFNSSSLTDNPRQVGSNDDNDALAATHMEHTAPNVRWKSQPLGGPVPSHSPRVGPVGTAQQLRSTGSLPLASVENRSSRSLLRLQGAAVPDGTALGKGPLRYSDQRAADRAAAAKLQVRPLQPSLQPWARMTAPEKLWLESLRCDQR
eukprot:jgi/Botrbrau1/15705/Bobra.4_1s0078.1